MAGRVWRARPLRRGDWEIEVTEPSGVSLVAGFVSLQEPIVRSSLTMQRILQTIAAEQGGTVAGQTGIDWPALGWTDQAEHDALVADISRIVRSWHGHPAHLRLLGYVNTEKAKIGIPTHPPYSLAPADKLDRIVRRAPEVVAQDLAAEGSAA